jgi:hypothetical protein
VLVGCSGGDGSEGATGSPFQATEGEAVEGGTLYALDGAGSVLMSELATSEVELRELSNFRFSDAGALLSQPLNIRLAAARSPSTLPFLVNLYATNALQGGGTAIVIKTGEDGGYVVPTEYIMASLEGEDTQRECAGTSTTRGLDCKPIWTFSIVSDYTDAAWAVISLSTPGRYPRGYEALKRTEDVVNLSAERQGTELTISWVGAPDLDTLIAYREGDSPPANCAESRVVRALAGQSSLTLDVPEAGNIALRACSFFTGLPASTGRTLVVPD